MGLLSWIKGVVDKMFRKDAEKAFQIEVTYSFEMDKAIRLWNQIVSGKPPWMDKEDNIETINFAKTITTDVAKKTCLDIDINISGSARADYLQQIIDNMRKKKLRDKVEDAAAVGGIMFKPNGLSYANNCIDYLMPDDFIVTEQTSNGDIKGCIFLDCFQEKNNYYTRMEYQHFQGEKYIIENKAYRSKVKGVLGEEIALKEVKAWEAIEPEVVIEGIKDTLFAYFKLPYNNTIDYNSPLGVSAFSNAIKELKDLDIAWCRKSEEIEDSRHMTFIPPFAARNNNDKKVKLPRFVKKLDIGGKDDENIHEHTATILTEERINDINSILSILSTKIGYSQGAFKLDGKTGVITATQVESDARETIETIKDNRDSLKECLEHLIYALDVYATLYNWTQEGKYETSYSFGDLTYNWEEDRARHWQYVQAGKYPLWKYYVEFEGMSEEEAKEVVAEAVGENKSRGLYDEE